MDKPVGKMIRSNTLEYVKGQSAIYGVEGSLPALKIMGINDSI